MTKKGFCFPAVKIAGNPTTRKEYDEGYILLDANWQLFHLKQTKGCPYIRAIQLPEGLQLKHLFITEFKSRKTLAFMTNVNNTLYILNNRTYDVVKAGISPFNPETDAISVFGNLFDWTIRVTTTVSDKYYALNAVDYSLIKSMEYTSSESSFAEKAESIFFLYARYLHLHRINL